MSLQGFSTIFWIIRWGFFPKISLDILDGPYFLQNKEIAYQDLRPGNILINNNHYSYITDAAEVNKAIKKLNTM